MPTIYHVENGNYHRSHGEALKEAREKARSEGREIEITKCTVAKLDLNTFLLAVNAWGGWASAQESMGMIQPRKKRGE